ncbi:hypothetical protein H4Q26_003294 [Puccinia striiformis f. sp. tritici PST-130]|nr:hypothetical protein H4Q26_003294 [Puccinia striiformis f. sp. tritici PST-130]
MDAEKSLPPASNHNSENILPCALEISIPPSHKKYSDSRASSDSSSESSSDNVVRDSSRNPLLTKWLWIPHRQSILPKLNIHNSRLLLLLILLQKYFPHYYYCYEKYSTTESKPTNDNQGTRVKPIKGGCSKGRSERRQAQKVQLVVKLKLNPLELDTYDLYADPILMKDIMIKPNTWRQRQSANEVLEHDQIGGNTQMEFGFYTKDMLVKCVHQLVSSLKHNETINCDEEDYVLFVDSGKWEELQKVSAWLVMPASDEKGSDNKNHQTQGSQAALNFLVTILKA